MKKILFLLAMLPMMWCCNGGQSKTIEKETGNDLGIWRILDVKNDFGETTGEKYLYASVDGFFSNSAASNAPLKVHIQIAKVKDDDCLFYSVRFDEYNNGTEDKHLKDITYGGKIVNREIRKCYKNTISEFYYTEINDKKNVLWDEVFITEGVWEYSLVFKYGRKYVFDIDSRGVNKAMELAGLKGLKYWRDD